MEESVRTTKRCSACGEEKPSSTFYPKRGVKDGLDSRCKPCRKSAQEEKKEAWEKARPNLSPDRTRPCSDCGIEKAASEFYGNPDCSDGLSRRCIPCTHARRKEQAEVRACRPRPISKICISCGTDKLLSEFHHQVGGKYGTHPWCKVCKSAKRRTGSPTPAILERQPIEEKACRSCGISKAPSEFYSNPENLDGLASKCIHCTREDRTKAADQAKHRERPIAKVCKACGVEKAGVEFYAHSGFLGGFDSSCKKCRCARRDLRGTIEGRVAEKKKRGPKAQDAASSREEKNLKKRLRRLYGLSPQQYEQMLSGQEFACAICRLSFEGIRVCIDHDHLTGLVRGALCTKCNIAIGHLEYLRGDPDRLVNTVNYYKMAGSYSGKLLETDPL